MTYFNIPQNCDTLAQNKIHNSMVEITYMVPDFLVCDYDAPITDVNDPGI